MAGIRKKPRNDGAFQGWYTDWTGKRRFFRGTDDRRRTLDIARRIESDHRQIALGYLAPPKSTDRPRRIAEIIAEYCEWGEAHGGLRGGPWGRKHAMERRRKLAWWVKELGLSLMSDLDDCLPRVEKALRSIAQSRAGKTVANYAEALAAFCDWSVTRGYLESDPLTSLSKFDTTPLTQRRALSRDEILRLLSRCRPEYRLLTERITISQIGKSAVRGKCSIAAQQSDYSRTSQR